MHYENEGLMEHLEEKTIIKVDMEDFAKLLKMAIKNRGEDFAVAWLIEVITRNKKAFLDSFISWIDKGESNEVRDIKTNKIS